VVDNLSKSVRSKIMRSIKSSGTRPELLVRKWVFALGYRYRLLKPRLPGRPDLIFPRQKKVIFVHGCFWHAHFWLSPECPMAREPKGNIGKPNSYLIKNEMIESFGYYKKLVGKAS